MLPFFIFLQLIRNITLRDHLDLLIIQFTLFYIYACVCVYTNVRIMYIKTRGMSNVLMTLVCNVSDLKNK